MHTYTKLLTIMTPLPYSTDLIPLSNVYSSSLTILLKVTISKVSTGRCRREKSCFRYKNTYAFLLISLIFLPYFKSKKGIGTKTTANPARSPVAPGTPSLWYIAVANKGNPAPTALRTTVLIDNAEAAFIRYVSIK